MECPECGSNTRYIYNVCKDCGVELPKHCLKHNPQDLEPGCKDCNKEVMSNDVI